MQTSYPAQIVAMEGADALAFAQAQFSSNVQSLALGQWQFSAWLDARGRVRAFFHLARTGDQQILLLLRGGHARDIAEGLKRFVFRSRLAIGAYDAHAIRTGPALPLHAVRGDLHALQLGCGDYAMEVASHGEPDDRWRLPQLRALWPWLPDDALETWLPASLGLDALQATALDKGCYPGQEIVARLHYRGGNKRHLYRLRLSRVLPAGSVLRINESESIPLLDVAPVGDGAEAHAIASEELAAEWQREIVVSHGDEPLRIQGATPLSA